MVEAEPVPAAYRKVGADGTLSQFVPTRRVRLYNYLQHVGQPTADEVETRVIGAVSIDAQKCSSCRMCAVFCPTGAIKKLDEGGVFGIVVGAVGASCDGENGGGAEGGELQGPVAVRVEMVLVEVAHASASSVVAATATGAVVAMSSQSVIPDSLSAKK